MSPLILRIRELREAKGWSQAALAERAGTRQATISELETGRTSRVDLPLLERIARALGVPAHELFDSTSAKPKPKKARP